MSCAHSYLLVYFFVELLLLWRSWWHKKKSGRILRVIIVQFDDLIYCQLEWQVYFASNLAAERADFNLIKSTVGPFRLVLAAIG